MTHGEWLDLMRFPREWVEWGMIPEELAVEQVEGYEPGQESVPEHWRHAAFQWWLKNDPGGEVLVSLVRLSWLDPDRPMGWYVRECIAGHRGCDERVRRELGVRYERV